MVVQIAYDFTCPWCWIAWHQARRLKDEFGVEPEWLAYELWPDDLEVPTAKPVPPPNPDRAPVPGRLELAYAASCVSKPRYNDHDDRIHNALEAAEHAKRAGVGNQMIDQLFTAMWVEGMAINKIEVLKSIAKNIVPDVGAMVRDVESRAGNDQIVPFDEGAYAKGVYNVPTFFIGNKKYAEQPWYVLERAIKANLK